MGSFSTQAVLGAHDRPRNQERGGGLVEVVPAQGAQLGPAQPRRGGQVDVRADQLVLGVGGGHQLGDDSHRRRLDVGARHPRRRGQQRRVAVDPTPLGRLLERPPDDGVDLADAGWPQTILIAQRHVEAVESDHAEVLDRLRADRRDDPPIGQAAVLLDRGGRQVIGDELQPPVQQLGDGDVRKRRRCGSHLGHQEGQLSRRFPLGAADHAGPASLLTGERVTAEVHDELPHARLVASQVTLYTRETSPRFSEIGWMRVGCGDGSPPPAGRQNAVTRDFGRRPRQESNLRPSD